MDSSIPNQKLPPSTMLHGPNSGRFDTPSIHPLSSTVHTSTFDPHQIARVYGSALAMRLTEERNMASQVNARLPGLDAVGQSNIMLDTVKGDDITVNHEDFMNTPDVRVKAPRVQLHTAMEIKLGL
mmetsp:Transcript_9055/g.18303  ORF Transcript_9055/g.18303 Transcript_9055/m.18303 type:complete len:126 (+) Transcript_9055:31-408(+)